MKITILPGNFLQATAESFEESSALLAVATRVKRKAAPETKTVRKGRGKKSGQRRISPNVAAEIVRRRKNGEKTKSVARVFGVSSQTVYNVMKRHGSPKLSSVPGLSYQVAAHR